MEILSTLSSCVLYSNHFLALLVIFLAALAFYYNKCARLAPGPFGLPLIGHVPWLTAKPHLTLQKWCRYYGDVMQINLGSLRVVILSSFKILKQDLAKRPNDFRNRLNFVVFQESFGGTSMVGKSASPEWQTKRKITRDAIRTLMAHDQSGVSAFDNYVSGEAVKFTDALLTSDFKSREKPSIDSTTMQQQIGVNVLDPRNLLHHSMANIAALLCFGRAVCEQDRISSFMTSVKGVVGQFVTGSLEDLFPWITWFYKPNKTVLLNDIRTTHGFVENLITSYDKTNKESTRETSCLMNLMSKSKHLRMRISDESYNYLPTEIFHASLLTGSEWLLRFVYLIAKYPDYQQRAHDEIYDVIGLNDSVRSEHQALLPFTEALIWESFRYAMTADSAIPYSASNDTSLGGYAVPKGTVVYVNTYAMSRDLRLWEQPEIFKPERFLEKTHNADNKNTIKNNNSRHKTQDFGGSESTEKLIIRQEKVEQLIAFGSGLRRCVGEQMGKTVQFIMATTILQRCDIKIKLDLPNGDEDVIDEGNLPTFKLEVKPRF